MDENIIRSFMNTHFRLNFSLGFDIELFLILGHIYITLIFC